ncbi:ATPase [uncultured Deinococcus sp.]|uniref:ATPase n=1 Tax=uncultured Deinococcus sp. TaxID=158789 RepID=UPI0025E5A469|nr:ATPase [uncultured Deinococcus sp.]
MSASALPFLRTAPPPPGAFEAHLGDLAVTVLVGVTGVGKSTALTALSGERFRVLPDRRRVTDAVMILPHAPQGVADREERFRLTAQYRDRHPGGMAHALGTLVGDTRHWGQRPVFDGLRGLDEVQYAAREYPGWRFVALGAPDAVRVRRLLGRADSFDRVGAGAAGHTLRAGLDALEGVEDVFTPAERDGLAALTAEGYTPTDVLAKVRIVVSERRHYDPAAAEAFLRTLPSHRALLLDTVAQDAAQVGHAVRAWA